MNDVRGRYRLQTYGAIALLILLTLLVYGDVLFSSGVLYGRDTIYLGYALAHFRHSVVSRGELPIWNPYMMCGFPQMSSTPFQPAEIVDRFFSVSRVPVVRYMFHTVLAGVLMYLLLRRLRLRSAASILGGIVFMFSGFFMSKVYAGHGGAFSSGVWIPLTFLCLERVIDTRRLRDALLLGAAVGIQLLGAHAQYVFYTVLAAVPYALFRLWPVCIRRAKPTEIAQYAGLAVVAVLFAAMTSAVFLLPFRELTAISNRGGGMSYSYASSLSLPPTSLITALFPNFWGTPTRANSVFGALYWDAALYVGLVPLLLSLVAVRWCTDPTARFFKWMTLAVIIVALGRNLPLYRLIYHFPGFDMIRAPSKILYLYAFAGATLSAYGLDLLLVHVGNLRPLSAAPWLSPQARYIDGLFKRTAAGCAGFFTLMLFGHPAVVAAAKALILRTRQNPDVYLAKVDSLVSTQLSSIGLGAVFAAAAALVVSRMLQRRMPARVGTALLLSLTFIDLWLYSNPLVRPARLQTYYGFNQREVDFLKRDQDVFRVLPVSTGAFRYVQGILTGIESVNGYYPLIGRRYGTLANAINGHWRELDVTVDITNYRSHLLDMLNVKYVLSRSRLSDPRLILVRPGNVNIYVNSGYLPRAFLVRDVRTAQSEREALRMVTSSSFNAKKTLVVENIAGPLPPARSGFRESVHFTKRTATGLALDVRAASPAYLFISDQYDPRWKAYIDGRPTRILLANYAFRAVQVPTGRHVVTMTYAPVSERIGYALTGTAYIIILGVLISLWLGSSARQARLRLKAERAGSVVEKTPSTF